MKATKKPVTIEFVQNTGNPGNQEEIMAFCPGIEVSIDKPENYIIRTLEVELTVELNDYIVKEDNRFSVMHPDIFAKTYDIVPE